MWKQCSFCEGLRLVSSKKFKKQLNQVINPYGDGYSAERAYSLIKSIDFESILAKKEDPLCE